MDIKNACLGINTEDTEALDSEISQLENTFIEKHFLDNDEAEQLEMLIAKAMKLGELYAKRDAKAQVPEGFVLVKKTKLMQIVGSAAIIEPITRGNPLMSKYKTELDFILSTVRAVIEAQEQKR